MKNMGRRDTLKIWKILSHKMRKISLTNKWEKLRIYFTLSNSYRNPIFSQVVDREYVEEGTKHERHRSRAEINLEPTWFNYPKNMFKNKRNLWALVKKLCMKKTSTCDKEREKFKRKFPIVHSFLLLHSQYRKVKNIEDAQ